MGRFDRYPLGVFVGMSLVQMSFQQFILIGKKFHAESKLLLGLDFVVPSVDRGDGTIDLDANCELALYQAACQYISGGFGSNCGPSKHQHDGSYEPGSGSAARLTLTEKRPNHALAGFCRSNPFLFHA